MKNIIIISLGSKTANSLETQLRNILKEKINIENYSLENEIPKNIDGDLVIFSSEEVKDAVLSDTNIKSKYMVVKRIIKHNSIDELINLEEGTEVLLVNDSRVTCEETIKQLISHGIDHLNYFPYYPGIKDYERKNIAITPGEMKLVPQDIERVIDIGTREMEFVSIIEALIYLGYAQEYGELLSTYSFRNIIDVSKRYIDIVNRSTKLTKILTDTLDNSKEGIIYTNNNYEVIVLNKVARDILKKSEEDFIGKNLYDLYEDLKEDIATINGNEIFVSRKEIYSNSILIGYVITLETISMLEKMDEERRIKKKYSNNSAKYNFQDMVGNNRKVKRTIELSKRLAKTNSTILIQGESGTGKEILAQSIHNNSDRKDEPFVAINFSALSENLLESELFGYEDGAFTGAKKGGKIGLFKRAHKGTIFLDEIGDAPYHFQTRLLRVLQEREVTPVGSTQPIPIDIRVIAATNKDLLEEVKNKRFREDLFYRINVMPIYSISLRERKDDIELLIKHYLKKNKCFFTLGEFMEREVLEFFKEYNWPGNIRELVNVVEYLINIKDEDKITIEDIPRYMIGNIERESDKIDFREFWVLEKIWFHNGIGRRTLGILAKEENIDLTEGSIRNILKKMEKENYIKINRGAKGTTLLERGKILIRSHK